MKYLKIQNKGVLDIRLVALMGGTTKSNDSFKIGQFGTGLKYTLAFLIRNNIDFHIYCGEEKINISVETEVIKNENFNIICINGNRTSITDRMGLEWEAWMIVRELWCNALDEGDSLKEEVFEHIGTNDTTTFYIQITTEIKQVIDEWNKYFIHTESPLFENETYSIYEGGEDFRLYKQGVLIHEVKNKKCLFSYDVKNADINELRQYMGSTSYAAFKCLQNATPSIIDYFLTNVNETHYEGSDCDYNWYESFGENWKKTIGSAKLIHQQAIDNIKSRGLDIDTTSIITVPKKIYEALTSKIEGISALRVSSKINEFYESFNTELENRIKQALVILEESDYHFSPELKFIYGVFGDKNIMAQVDLDKKEVLISENLLSKSLFMIVSVLIEESEHFKTGLSDCTRAFQQHFIDLYTKKLLEKAKIEL